jgi:hypothetical protein
MSAYHSHIQAEAHAEDLREQARRPHAARTSRGHPLRHSTARALLRLAIRLEPGLRPTTVH